MTQIGPREQQLRALQAERLKKGRLQAVTVEAPVTKSVTPPVTPAVTSSRLGQDHLVVENKRLRGELAMRDTEIAMLKQELAKAHGGGKVAMTGAERMRQMRAKKKEKRK